MSSTSTAALLLQRQLKDLQQNPVEGFFAGLVDDNIFEWEITVIGAPDTLYEEGLFSARLFFPKEYPNEPPTMKFISDMFHPNVYPDGTVCISILHSPGDDKYGYESAGERWSPVHTVETILISVISMLSSPNYESPANVDAAVSLPFVDTVKILMLSRQCAAKTIPPLEKGYEDWFVILSNCK